MTFETKIKIVGTRQDPPILLTYQAVIGLIIELILYQPVKVFPVFEGT